MPKKSGPKKERKPNDSYVIPNIRLKSTTKRILAIDPGSRNMAFSSSPKRRAQTSSGCQLFDDQHHT